MSNVRRRIEVASLKDPEGAELRALGALVDFSGQRVLEIGCGDGRMTWLYAEQAADVVGIDVDEESIRDARAALPDQLADRVAFQVAEAESLDVPPQRFDIAFLSWSL
ncbi:MAG: class I SAM-dependent methyltransferase [Actinomycetota bacterium]